MSNTIGNTEDLDISRTEALQGSLSSLGHTTETHSDSALTTKRRRKLSEKNNEILGDGELTPGGQPSQLPNEDGLPFIDISDPANRSCQTSILPTPSLEQDLTPLSLLPLDERERWRRERDRILDFLEEEERLQQLQEEREVEEERKDAIRKRKESAKAELDQLKAVRDLQKKMGRALVQQDEGTEENRQGENAHRKSQVTSSAAKKRVSFADVPTATADERDQQTSIGQLDWGDVTLGRLRAQSLAPLASTVEAQKYPMKMHVVERHSTAPPTSPFHNGTDSDDESISSAGQLSSQTENEEGRSSSSSDGLLDDRPPEEGFDYNTAHHREIALEYHKKRHALGAETTRILAPHSLDDYEQHEASNGQIPLSHFRANRMAAAYDKSYGPISTSIGQTTIPAFRQKSLRESVRLGKLENDQLVGGDSGESGTEDETVREIIQMLQTGGVHNVGPDFELLSMSTNVPPRNSGVVELLPGAVPTTAHATNPSRFKSSRGGITRTTTFQDNKREGNDRSQLTVSSIVERKAPESFPNQLFPVNGPALRPSVEMSELVPPMVIDSPSFPMKACTSTVVIPSSSPYPATASSPSPHQMQRRPSPPSDLQHKIR